MLKRSLLNQVKNQVASIWSPGGHQNRCSMDGDSPRIPQKIIGMVEKNHPSPLEKKLGASPAPPNWAHPSLQLGLELTVQRPAPTRGWADGIPPAGSIGSSNHQTTERYPLSLVHQLHIIWTLCKKEMLQVWSRRFLYIDYIYSSRGLSFLPR